MVLKALNYLDQAKYSHRSASLNRSKNPINFHCLEVPFPLQGVRVQPRMVHFPLQLVALDWDFQLIAVVQLGLVLSMLGVPRSSRNPPTAALL